MDLRVLRYFLAIAREGTISGAADFLHISQPTLSRQILDLEAELGKKLFIRGRRKIALTEDGMLLKRRAEEIVELVEKTEAEFLVSDEIVSGDIHIGCGETYAMHTVAKVIKDLQNGYPHIGYHLFSGSAEDVSDRLDKGLVDFGILIEPADMVKYDSLRLPDADTWGVLMRRDNPLADREQIVPEDLWDLPLILSRRAKKGDRISDWLKMDYEQLNVVATYNLLYNASLLVEEGVGYALCLDKILDVSGKGPLVFRPLEPQIEAGANIAWKKYQVFPKAAKIFLSKLRESLNLHAHIPE